MTENTQTRVTEMNGILAWIEKSGNKLPDPVFIFLYCIAAVIAISVVAALFGVGAAKPLEFLRVS